MRKKLLYPTLVILISGAIFFIAKEKRKNDLKTEFANFLQNHEYSKRKLLTREELKAIPKADRPDLAFEQDFLRTVSPITHTLNKEALIDAISQVGEAERTGRTIDFTWESRGPLDVSGRTRALIFDPNDTESKRVFAGGVGGGIWMNTDITDGNVSWTQVATDMSNFAVTAMDFDPVVTTTFYAGTGEGWGNIDAINGAGIYKTTDGGTTWSLLSSTSSFDFVYDLVVRNEGGSQGVIYTAARIGGNTDVFRSDDGGATWTTVSTEPFRDLEIAGNNDLWAGEANGEIHKSTNGTTWTNVYSSTVASARRVEVAVAPSNSDIVYALVTSGSALGEIVVTFDGGANWSTRPEPADVGDGSVPNDDFTRGQAWYDLIAAVSPTDPNTIFVGGVNTFKSTDGGSVWLKTSSWSSGWDNSVSFAHADIHNIVFRPGHNEALIATDGGIFYVPDVNAVPTSGPNAFTTGMEARNLNYNVTQFYSGAIDPANTNGFMGGTQDNGTPYFDQSGIDDTNDFSGGDGGFCFIDQTAINGGTDGAYYIVSNTGNAYRLHDFSTNTFSIPLISNGNNGSFINVADYDDENNVLYSYNGNNQITVANLEDDLQPQSVGGVFQGTNETITISQLNNQTVSHIRVSPHNAQLRALFLGTNQGTILKRTIISTDVITNPSVTGSVSCIEVGANDDELLVTYSNYDVTSVWYTNDGGTTWQNKEGNLPNMPVRWSLFNPLDRNEVILATEAGIWRTSNINATTPVWESVSTGMGSVRVDMLQYRQSDNLVLAATHGRGMFTSNFTADAASVEDVLADKKVFTVFPTISDGNFTVFAKNELGNSKIQIFDISGKQVYNSQLDFNEERNQPVSVNLGSGIYILNIIDQNNRKSSSKIIVR